MERLRGGVRAKGKRGVQLTFELDKTQLQTRQQVAHATEALKTQNMLLSKEVYLYKQFSIRELFYINIVALLYYLLKFIYYAMEIGRERMINSVADEP